jgi:hypothetical protein
MRQQHSPIGKSNHLLPKEIAPESFQLIMADSMEVMEYYYRGKIQELEQSLSQLNLLENARQIASLCKEVIRTKEILQRFIIKKGARGSIQPSVE